MSYRAYLYAKKTHPRKPDYWRKRKYWASSTSAGQVKGTASPDDPRLGDYWTKRSAAWYTLIGHQSILLAWIICMSVIASHALWLYTIVSRSGSVFVIKDDLHALSYFSGTFQRK